MEYITFQGWHRALQIVAIFLKFPMLERIIITDRINY